MLHKPQGLLSATRDPKTPTVLSLLPEKLQKRGLFPVGRLDKDTTGLLLLTDDGAYAHRLTAPKSDIPKTYIAALSKPVTENRLDILRRPFTLPPDDGHPPIQCRAACVQLLPVGQTGTCVQVTITEGKYHEIKRMFRLIGFEVIALHRRSVGGLELDSALPPGAWRVCSAEEIAKAENR
jgi:16S rRNA pseudouridine516 synthase